MTPQIEKIGVRDGIAYTLYGSALYRLPEYPEADPVRFRHYSCRVPVYDSFNRVFRRCRRCGPCMKAKQNLWAWRAKREVEGAPRTWFVTLTFASVPDDPYDLVQLFLKRVRKNNPMKPFRYLCVVERGSLHGRLHFHLLIHCHRELRRRDIEQNWGHGFSKAKLFRPEHAYYVCKYVTKSAESTIRASNNYGQPMVMDWDVCHIPIGGGRKAPLLKVPF